MSYLFYGSDFSREVICLRPSTPEDLIQFEVKKIGAKLPPLAERRRRAE